ncbi:hypothetical protein [Streptomyces beihaiensis]|uniref:Uncharacterized protein n=1 Tax=Streptomyces beihaiensis TaxID=2984495 RepID=A0ABT3TMI8_9ACTN|nr:hypothetical protein [Streptomyces beihaiensis]MCX3058236.1 hypothetical protein [Streptomyces beihaiensis]
MGDRRGGSPVRWLFEPAQGTVVEMLGRLVQPQPQPQPQPQARAWARAVQSAFHVCVGVIATEQL